MEEKKSNSKIIWTVLFTLVSVVLCYLFIVVYFYFISPNNISAKLTVWPFTGETNVAKIYKDAVVDIKFNVFDDDLFENVEKTAVGVNVRQDGFIITPYSEIDDCQDGNYKILTNSGKVFNGKLLFAEKNYNLAVLKCEYIAEGKGDIKIPYVKVARQNPNELSSIYAISSLSSSDYWKGYVYEDGLVDCKKTEIDTRICVDYVVEDCYTIYINKTQATYQNCAIFDGSGSLLGFSSSEAVDNNIFATIPVYGSYRFLNKVIQKYYKNETYQNSLVDSFYGLDKNEMSCFIQVSSLNEDEDNKKYFYFNDTWKTYSSDMIFYNQQPQILGFYIVDKLVYRDQELLQEGNVVVALIYHGVSHEITSRLDLVNLLYQFDEGETISLVYYDKVDNLSSRTNRVNIVV